MDEKSPSFLKENWKKYTFELLVIIAGITISFGLQNWQENQRHRTAEIRLIERLLEDLRSDTTYLRSEIESMTETLKGGQRLMNLENAKEMGDSMNLYLNLQLQYTVFSKSDIAYQGLKQTGRSDLVTNHDLLDRIVKQYSMNYRTLDEWAEIDKNFVIGQFIPYLNQHFPIESEFSSAGEVVETLRPFIKERAFQNLLRFNFGLKMQIREEYRENIESTAELMSELEAELARIR